MSSTPTPIYTASKFSEYERVRWFNERVRSVGDSITHDWTVGDEFDDNGHPKEYDADNPKPVRNAAKYAERDLIGVDLCEVLVCLAHQELCGALVELGYALARSKVIILVSPYRYTVFWDLPQIIVVNSVEDLPWIQGRQWRDKAWPLDR